MSSIASLTAQPTTMRVGGSTYLLYPLSIADFGKLQAWIDSQFPDPFALAREQMQGGRFSSMQQQYLMKLAMDKAMTGKPKLGSTEADSLLNSPEGIKEILFLSISKGDPGFTRERASDVFNAMSMTDMSSIGNSTTTDMVAHDPKERRPTGKRSGRKTPRPNRKAEAASTGTSSITKP